MSHRACVEKKSSEGHPFTTMNHFQLTYRDDDSGQIKTIDSFSFMNKTTRKSAVTWMALEMKKKGLKAEQVVNVYERRTK